MQKLKYLLITILSPKYYNFSAKQHIPIFKSIRQPDTLQIICQPDTAMYAFTILLHGFLSN